MLTLALAEKLADLVEQAAREKKGRAVSVAVVDAGGNIVLVRRQDGCGWLRPEIAVKMAQGAVAMGCRSSALEKMMNERPALVQTLQEVAKGRFFPVSGGVVIQATDGRVLGALAVSGEKASMNEVLAVQAIQDAGLIAGA